MTAYYSTADTAELLGLSVRTVRDQVRKGSLRAVSTQAGYLIASTEIIRYRAQSLGRVGRRRK